MERKDPITQQISQPDTSKAGGHLEKGEKNRGITLLRLFFKKSPDFAFQKQPFYQQPLLVQEISYLCKQ